MFSILLLLIAQPEGLPTCDEEKADQGVQQEMNICAAHEFYAADAELNEAWAVARDAMKERDVEANDALQDWDDRPGYFATMLEAQRAWLIYRDEHCRSEGYRARGGSLEPLLTLTCKTVLTTQRAEQLRELALTY